jgi:hypothetical protein
MAMSKQEKIDGLLSELGDQGIIMISSVTQSRLKTQHVTLYPYKTDKLDGRFWLLLKELCLLVAVTIFYEDR